MKTNKPRIFVDGRVFDTEYQGTRTYIHNLYKIIDNIGDFEIFLASCNPENAAGFFPGSAGIRFIRYHTISKLKRVFHELPEMMTRYHIDAAHYQYVAPPRKNCLQIVTIHDLLFKDFPREFGLAYRMVKGAAFYLSAKRADLVTTVSAYSKKAIVRHFSIPEENIHVVPNGVSGFYFESYDKQKAAMEVWEKFGFRNYLLYVSRIEPRKNQLDLLRVYLELELYRQGKCLVFVGKTSIPVPQLKEILAPLEEEVRKKIFFLEDIANADLRSLYRAAELFVYPSKGEGFGIPPLEAGALGIPTICSNTTAMGDFTFFGDRHIYPDAATLKMSITRALAERPSNLREISNTIRRRYGWENAAFTMNELIWKKIGRPHHIYTVPSRHPNDLLIS
ncbi:MAG TPA: glycosyltransferase family 1 protein [Puia sp.]|jgi:glycosyltransferase involved in cell wall biosynthesis|nr:glycosyltransferase family 1 protein [Puia sp.]